MLSPGCSHKITKSKIEHCIYMGSCGKNVRSKSLSYMTFLHMLSLMMWQGYKGLLSIPKENKELLDLLAQGRLQLAYLFGQESYADYALDTSCLAGRPAAVTGFLHNLNTALQPQVS